MRMGYKIRILLLSFFISTIYAKAVQWQKLKAVKSYISSEYHLKEGVEYLEIRNYYRGINDKGYNIKGYRVTVSMQKSGLTSFSLDIVEKFKASSPNLSKETNIKRTGFCLMSGCFSNISNGFMIDSHEKIWRMNMVEDVVGMLGEIDTPAEVKIVLWLNDKNRGTSDENYKDKYKKTAKGYTVISEYDNSVDNIGECGHFTFKIHISKDGKITEKKLLKKTLSKNGCMTVD